MLDGGAPIFTPHGRVILALIGAAGVTAVYRWLSKRRLGTGYGLIWIAVFTSLIGVAAFPRLVPWVAWVAGSREPEGGLRLVAFSFTFVILLYLSLKTSQLQHRVDELVQALALKDAPKSAPPPALPPDAASGPIAD